MSMNIYCNMVNVPQTTTEESEYVMGDFKTTLLKGNVQCTPALSRLIMLAYKKLRCQDAVDDQDIAMFAAYVVRLEELKDTPGCEIWIQ